MVLGRVSLPSCKLQPLRRRISRVQQPWPLPNSQPLTHPLSCPQHHGNCASPFSRALPDPPRSARFPCRSQQGGGKSRYLLPPSIYPPHLFHGDTAAGFTRDCSRPCCSGFLLRPRRLRAVPRIRTPAPKQRVFVCLAKKTRQHLNKNQQQNTS